MKRNLNGRDIEYNDVIHHSTETRFSFLDRLKILFGCRCFVQSEIYCKNESVHVVGSEGKVMFSRWFWWLRRNKPITLSKNDTNAVQPKT